MYKIKQIPEDFVVNERSSPELQDRGNYAIFRLKKKDFTTLKACQIIADSLKIPLKNIGFAGAKDRQAVTEQVISIKKSGKSAEKVSNDLIQISFLGYSDNPISLGDLKGNHFIITIRNLENETPDSINQIINYFDDQRFSTNNHLVGKAIIKKDFKTACGLLEKEKLVKDHLKERPKDFVGAIKKVPFKIRTMYIHAYQSWLFNQTIIGFIKDLDCIHVEYSLGTLLFPKKDMKEFDIPLIGFQTERSENSGMNRMIENIKKQEDISERDFITKSMPELSAEGGLRPLVVKITDLKIDKPEIDNLNEGKNKITVEFNLPKGSYATIVIKRMLA